MVNLDQMISDQRQLQNRSQHRLVSMPFWWNNSAMNGSMVRRMLQGPRQSQHQRLNYLQE